MRRKTLVKLLRDDAAIVFRTNGGVELQVCLEDTDRSVEQPTLFAVALGSLFEERHKERNDEIMAELINRIMGDQNGEDS